MAMISAAQKEMHDKVLSNAGYLREVGRSLLEVTGADRLDWLHNLTTNAVKTLSAGDGNYAFAISVQGRTLFDLNILVLDASVWLDIDSRWVDDALAHLGKYVVVEDVELKRISDDWSRVDVLGSQTAGVVEALGLGHHFTALADVQHVSGTIAGAAVRLVKDNLGSINRATIYVRKDHADAFSRVLADAVARVGGMEIDAELFDCLRIEAGVPKSVDDIDHAVIAPETLQIERGISYHKGCYLGQEVIERMRSRQSMSRKLVSLSIEHDNLPPHNAPIIMQEKEIGRVTSACHSPILGGVLGLGYVKSLLAHSGDDLRVQYDRQTTAPIRVLDGPLIP